jgi:hypothetical protein
MHASLGPSMYIVCFMFLSLAAGVLSPFEGGHSFDIGREACPPLSAHIILAYPCPHSCLCMSTVKYVPITYRTAHTQSINIYSLSRHMLITYTYYIQCALQWIVCRG